MYYLHVIAHTQIYLKEGIIISTVIIAVLRLREENNLTKPYRWKIELNFKTHKYEALCEQGYNFLSEKTGAKQWLILYMS